MPLKLDEHVGAHPNARTRTRDFDHLTDGRQILDGRDGRLLRRFLIEAAHLVDELVQVRLFVHDFALGSHKLAGWALLWFR